MAARRSSGTVRLRSGFVHRLAPLLRRLKFSYAVQMGEDIHPYRKSGSRVPGKDAELPTKVGELTLKVPKLRALPFSRSIVLGVSLRGLFRTIAFPVSVEWAAAISPGTTA